MKPWVFRREPENRLFLLCFFKKFSAARGPSHRKVPLGRDPRTRLRGGGRHRGLILGVEGARFFYPKFCFFAFFEKKFFFLLN